MFGSRHKRANSPISDAVRAHLADADEDTVEIVAAFAALLAAVAYADSDWSLSEASQLELELSRVQGLSPKGASAITALLAHNKLDLATTQVAQSARTLRERADRDLRIEFLNLLVSIAAADGTIQLAEVTMLRNITKALGLSQDDYNTAQNLHREKLSFL